MQFRSRPRVASRTAGVIDGPWRGVAPAIALLLASVAIISAATLNPSGRREEYAVVAPPWYGWARTVSLVSRAGGALVDFGGLKNVVIAHSASRAFVDASYRAGAWLVIDPVVLRGCLGFSPHRPANPRGQ